MFRNVFIWALCCKVWYSVILDWIHTVYLDFCPNLKKRPTSIRLASISRSGWQLFWVFTAALELLGNEILCWQYYAEVEFWFIFFDLLDIDRLLVSLCPSWWMLKYRICMWSMYSMFHILKSSLWLMVNVQLFSGGVPVFTIQRSWLWWSWEVNRWKGQKGLYESAIPNIQKYKTPFLPQKTSWNLEVKQNPNFQEVINSNRFSNPPIHSVSPSETPHIHYWAPGTTE